MSLYHSSSYTLNIPDWQDKYQKSFVYCSTKLLCYNTKYSYMIRCLNKEASAIYVAYRPDELCTFFTVYISLDVFLIGDSIGVHNKGQNAIYTWVFTTYQSLHACIIWCMLLATHKFYSRHAEEHECNCKLICELYHTCIWIILLYS